jgi:iron(III) transport system permease protein
VASSRAQPDPGRTRLLRAAAAGVGLIFAGPFVYLLVRNVGSSGAMWDAMGAPGARASLGRSLVLGIAVAVSASAIGTAASWLVARTDLPGRALWRVLLPLPLVIPSFIGAFVLIAAFAPGGVLESALGMQGLPAVSGFAGSFATLTLFTYPYVYLPAMARLRQLPASLEESARLLGMGPVQTFFAVVLPQARSAILAGSLLVFLYTISDFGVVQLMRYRALTRVIYSTRLFDSVTSLALSLQLAVLALVVVSAERALAGRSGHVRTARRGPALRIRLGAWRFPGLVFIAALVGLSLLVPIAVLSWWAVRGFVGGTRAPAELAAALSELAGPALNTSISSVAAAAVALAVVMPVAYLSVRTRSRVGDVVNAVVVAGFAIPGLTLALALVFWTLAAPAPVGALYQTVPLLVAAYTIHFGAHSLRSAQVAIGAVPPQVDEAASTLGARRLRRLVAVELPLMLPGLLAGSGLVLLSAMKELPATLLLAPAGWGTLATEIWTATESALFADASIAALLLIALSGVLTWALVIRRSDSLV